jgi:predicted enzyme related to lactoylglutathione lyase
MENNVGFIALFVDDLYGVKDWYVKQLDLFVVSDGDDSVVLAGKNGFAVELRKGKPLDHPERVVLGVHSDEIDVLFRRLHEAGTVEILTGADETKHGRRIIRTHDPAGHTVELFEVEQAEAMQDLSLENR